MSMQSPEKKSFWDIEPYPITWRLVPKEEWENDPVKMKQREEEEKFWSQLNYPEEILELMRK